MDTSLPQNTETMTSAFICVLCGWVYVEAVGYPAGGIAPGTCWKDVPDDWTCPDCGACKVEFEMVEL